MRRIGISSIAACALAVLFQASGAQAAPPGGLLAQAAPTGPTCKAAYRDAEEQEQAGHLVEARSLLAGCARKACGKAMLASCTEMFNRVDGEVPTIVPRVTDDPRTDVDVKIDGNPVTSKLNGESIPVNPGLHEVAFSTGGNVFATRKLMIAEGTHRVIAVTMHAADNNAEHPDTAPAGGEATKPAGGANAEPPTPVSPSATPITVPEVPVSDPKPNVLSAVPWVLGGIGVAGVGVGTWLFSTGKRDRVDMAVDSTAVGVGALVVAVVLFATSHPSKESARPATSLLVDVHPLHEGAFAAVGAAF